VTELTNLPPSAVRRRAGQRQQTTLRMDDPVHGPVAAQRGPDGGVLPPRLDHIVDDLTLVNELLPAAVARATMWLDASNGINRDRRRLHVRRMVATSCTVPASVSTATISVGEGAPKDVAEFGDLPLGHLGGQDRLRSMEGAGPLV
jgi:hypothetical protein